MTRSNRAISNGGRGAGLSSGSPQSVGRSSQPRLRCAIYTRKSTEEGLDQEFNSLDAQREACAAFVTSQVGLGWKLLPDSYDDGGISGGTMERPALQRLLQDIKNRCVDVVVVYKIDRLTRSLADFAKIVEVFDGHSVSFVSVTQQFNTTTSMGRLTLNVLLSFAQFEREVTAERIRDKIAASRKKGMWMGGRVPLGYRVVDRKLQVDPAAAEIVRRMFTRLLELGSVGELLAELRRQYPSGICIEDTGGGNGSSGSSGGGSTTSHPAAKPKLVLMRGPLTYLLSNTVYIGKVKHHDMLHDGEHEPIIDHDLFNRVQNQLKRRSPRRARSTNGRSVHLLVGLLYDETGDRFAPTSCTNHGRRYRYYISSRLRAEGRNSGNGWRLPAEEIEGLVIRQIGLLLQDRKLLSEWIVQYASHARLADGLQRAEAATAALASTLPSEKQRLLGTLLRRIVVAPNKITFEVDPIAVVELVVGKDSVVPSGAQSQLPNDGDDLEPSDDQELPIYRFERSTMFTRRGRGTRIIVEGPEAKDADDGLVDLIARSHCFLARLTDGSYSSIKELAAVLEIHPADISRILPLAFLTPTIVEQILKGTQPANLAPARLRRGIDIPAHWSQQCAAVFQ